MPWDDWSPRWVNGMYPSGKHTKNYGKSPCLMGKSTISMAIFNSYVSLPEGNWDDWLMKTNFWKRMDPQK